MIATLCAFCTQVFAAGTIVLKIVGVNPSKEQAQPIDMKAYLPKEIMPGDVVDKDDMTLTYDTQMGAYFVSGSYTLEPGETLEKQIKVKDIWQIPTADITGLQQEAVKSAAMIGDSTYKERAEFLRDSIAKRLEQIAKKQATPVSNPQRHISEYRENKATLDSVQADLLVLRSLLAQSKTFPAMTVWKVILFIVGFLTILSIALYVLWTSQMQSLTESKYTSGEAAENAFDSKNKE